MDQSSLESGAEKPDIGPVTGRRCEAFYAIAIIRLVKGDRAGARDNWQKCVATGVKDYVEYSFAIADLDHVKTTP